MARFEALTEERKLATQDGYLAAIKPLIDKARETVYTLRPYQRTIRDLRQRQAALNQRLLEHVLNQSEVTEIDRRLIRVTADLRTAESKLPTDELETLRQQRNDIITMVNQTRAVRLARQTAPEGLTLETRQIQIAKPRPNIAVREPSSPGLPHNDLGQLAIHRSIERNTRLLPDIAMESTIRWPENRENEKLALTLVHLLPKNIIDGINVPAVFSDKTHLAKGVAEVTQLILNHRAGILNYPNPFELGTPGFDQDKYIQTYLQSLLAEYLGSELSHPEQNENQIRSGLFKFNKAIRDLVRWVTPSDNQIDQEDAYTRIGRVIENLPHDVQTLMITSRLSVTLFSDLDFPGIDFISSRRFAELIRNTSFIKNNLKRYRTATSIFGVLTERWRAGDLDVNNLFEEIASLDYNGKVLDNITDFASDSKYLSKKDRNDLMIHDLNADQIREDLLLLLSETGQFRDFAQRLLNDISDEDCDEFSRPWTNDEGDLVDDGFFGYHPYREYNIDPDGD